MEKRGERWIVRVASSPLSTVWMPPTCTCESVSAVHMSAVGGAAGMKTEGEKALCFASSRYLAWSPWTPLVRHFDSDRLCASLPSFPTWGGAFGSNRPDCSGRPWRGHLLRAVPCDRQWLGAERAWERLREARGLFWRKEVIFGALLGRINGQSFRPKTFRFLQGNRACASLIFSAGQITALTLNIPELKCSETKKIYPSD